ncbi:MAG: tyrosine protein phosphatase [bacterium]|nr:tyrosine protein phosphatase [bacterium]
MIDIHCHILPGIDDGAETIEESLEMARMAVTDGIRTIVATPHQHNGVYTNSTERIRQHVEHLRTALQEADISLEILPGADVHIDVNASEKIKTGEIMTVNQTGRYFLLEFPAHTIPPNIEKITFDLLLKNITPILTHPERIAEVQENPQRIYDLVASGVLSQITAMSLSGGFGRRAQKCAKILLQHNMAHIIASDGHSTNSRPPILSEGLKAAGRIVGDEFATAMVTSIPQQIIKGETVPHLDPPIPIKHKFFGLW